MAAEENKIPSALNDNLEQDERAGRIKAAGQRARAEAQDRRQQRHEAAFPPEKGGQKGPEPTRYGDWEKNGVISDF